MSKNMLNVLDLNLSGFCLAIIELETDIYNYSTRAKQIRHNEHTKYSHCHELEEHMSPLIFGYVLRQSV